MTRDEAIEIINKLGDNANNDNLRIPILSINSDWNFDLDPDKKTTNIEQYTVGQLKKIAYGI